MSERSAVHSTFVIERVYDATPTRVFQAWADPGAKSQWFGPPGAEHSLEFAVGGREQLTVQMDGGDVYRYDARYQDIVPDERIIHTYSMERNDERISVSVATVEIVPDGDGARLKLTEQGTYLDGHDTPEQREHGTREFLDALGGALAGAAGRA